MTVIVLAAVKVPVFSLSPLMCDVYSPWHLSSDNCLIPVLHKSALADKIVVVCLEIGTKAGTGIMHVSYVPCNGLPRVGLLLSF